MSKKLNIKVNRNPQGVIPKNDTPNPEVYYRSAENALSFFTPQNAPDTYEGLKKEVKFLERVHAQSFVVLAHRLKLIRDGELYKKDGYEDFKAFIEGELEVGRTTVYNYISLLEVFGVQTFGQDVKISNLITILKPIKEHPEDKGVLLNKANELSNRELQKFIKENYILKNEDEEEQGEGVWCTSKEELLNNFSFLKGGLRPKTQIKMMRGLLNLRMIEDPNNNILLRIKKLMDKLVK